MADLPTRVLARTCSSEGCGRIGKMTRGLCSKHYRRWLDHTPAADRPVAPRFSRTFWEFVEKTDTCWVWVGVRNPNGYGFWSRQGQTGLAHRVSWEMAHGPITGGLWVLHHCDNRPCVNPAHLYLGTVVENTRDAVERGRLYRPPPSAECPRGHAIAGDNLRLINLAGGGTKRVCRECDNSRSRVRAAARRARLAPPKPPGRLSTRQVIERYGVLHATVFRWHRQAKLSAAVKRRNENWWLEAEVLEAVAGQRA